MRHMNVETLPRKDRILYLALSRGPVEEVKYYSGREAYETNRFRAEYDPGLWDGVDLDDIPTRKEYRSGWYLDASGPYHLALLEYLDSQRIAAIRKAAAMWGFKHDDPDTLSAAGID